MKLKMIKKNYLIKLILTKKLWNMYKNLYNKNMTMSLVKNKINYQILMNFWIF